MKVYGESKQEEEPTPEYPKEIINRNYITVNGFKMYIKSDRKIKRIFQENGVWYVEYWEE